VLLYVALGILPALDCRHLTWFGRSNSDICCEECGLAENNGAVRFGCSIGYKESAWRTRYFRTFRYRHHREAHVGFFSDAFEGTPCDTPPG